MTQGDFQKFAILWRAAAEAVGKKAPGEGALALSYEGLKRFSLDQIKAAVAAHLAGPEGRFMPTPSHIVEQIEGRPEDRAAVAWATVERELKIGKGYESVRFPLPAYHYAIEQMGGWISLSDKYDAGSARDLQYMAQKFAQFYGIAERLGADWGDVPEYLVGVFESERSGRPEAKKVRIAETGEFITHDELFRRLDSEGSPEQAALEGQTVAAALAEGKTCRF